MSYQNEMNLLIAVSQQWLNVAKKQIKECAKKRIYERLEKIKDVINNVLPSNLPRFIIDDSLKEQICNQVSYAIDEFNGYKKSKKIANTEEETIKAVRSWWNRLKATKLASLVFAVICFYVLYNFIEKQCDSLRRTQQIVLFIDVFKGFMSEFVKFPKTKPRALIPHQCFLIQSEFKDICSAFIEIFGDNEIKWNCNIKKVGVVFDDENGKKKYKYIKEKNRSKNLFDAFGKCLDDIRFKLINNNNNNNIDINILHSKWSAVINKFKPKGYELSFKSSDDEQNIASIDTLNTFNNNNNNNINNNKKRQFQSTNNFCLPSNRIHFKNIWNGNNINYLNNNNNNNHRIQRREQHIKEMRNNKNNNNYYRNIANKEYGQNYIELQYIPHYEPSDEFKYDKNTNYVIKEDGKRIILTLIKLLAEMRRCEIKLH